METRRITPIAAIVWARLEASPPVGDGLTARLAVPDQSDIVLAAVDADNRRHILIRLKSIDEGIYDSDSRGLAVSTRDLRVTGEEPLRHVDITCQDSTGYDALDLIGAEIALRISTSRQTAAESVRNVLAKWRRFWGRTPRNVLSRSEQIGLYAELWFLRFWLLERVGVEEAVLRWRGPFGARHDFEWAGRSVEVKGTTSARRVVHRINGIDQLSPPESGELLFFSLQLREERGAIRTLPTLVDSCREATSISDTATARLESALATVGYADVHRQEYEAFHFRTVREGLYRVTDTFPRLTREQFQPSLPSGIEQIEYDINLAGQDALLLASSNTDDLSLN